MIAIQGTGKTDCRICRSRRAASFRNEYTLSISSRCCYECSAVRTGPTVRVCACASTRCTDAARVSLHAGSHVPDHFQRRFTLSLSLLLSLLFARAREHR